MTLHWSELYVLLTPLGVFLTTSTLTWNSCSMKVLFHTKLAHDAENIWSCSLRLSTKFIQSVSSSQANRFATAQNNKTTKSICSFNIFSNFRSCFSLIIVFERLIILLAPSGLHMFQLQPRRHDTSAFSPFSSSN